jgi:hypothetical protein
MSCFLWVASGISPGGNLQGYFHPGSLRGVSSIYRYLKTYLHPHYCLFSLDVLCMGLFVEVEYRDAFVWVTPGISTDLDKEICIQSKFS